MNDVNETSANNERVLVLQKKATVFQEQRTLVHISYKRGHWKRGIIKSISRDFFTLNERYEGEMPVFFLEIVDIRPFTPPREVSR